MTDRTAADHTIPNTPAPSSPTAARIRIGAPEVALLSGTVLVFLFLVFRSIGLHPSIFTDECTYSVGSRLTRFATASTPLYVYFFVYRITRHCGSEFLECARVLNAFFFVAAAPFIYLVARRVTGKPIAVLVAMLSLLSPIDTYTAYFMPEAMYFFGFWLLTWVVLSFRQSSPLRYGMAVGSLLATLMLVKVNAVFLLPAIALFIIWSFARERSWVRFKAALLTIGYIVLSAAVVRLGIGFLSAQKAGLNVLGTRYGSLANSSLTPARLADMTAEIFGVLQGHVMGLALLCGLPLAAAITIALQGKCDADLDGNLQTISAYALVLLLTLLVVAAYFTAAVMGEGPYESLARLHMRYYNFLFPLFLIVVAGQISGDQKRRSPYIAGISAAALAALIAHSFHSLLHLYSPRLIDSPELHAITAGRAVFYVVGILGIVSLVVWVFNQMRGAQLFLFVFLPVSVVWSATTANSELRGHLSADVYDRSGIFTRNELDPEERSRLVVVGSDLASLYRVLFYVDHPKATVAVLASGAAFDRSAVPADRRWVLLLGDHAVPSDVVDQIAGDGFVLFKLPAESGNARAGSSETTVDFAHTFRFGRVRRVSGLSVPESFGRWSDGREVQIEMSASLPRAFDLHLTGHAFGPNTRLPFLIRIGDETETFRLSSSPSQVDLHFSTKGDQNLITIEVPEPASPKQWGLGSDDRLLGIALTGMTIVPDSKSGQ